MAWENRKDYLSCTEPRMETEFFRHTTFIFLCFKKLRDLKFDVST